MSFDWCLYRYPYFIMCIMLAAIDHNMHLSRGQQMNAAGEERGYRKYSKRTQKFHAETQGRESVLLLPLSHGQNVEGALPSGGKLFLENR